MLDKNINGFLTEVDGNIPVDQFSILLSFVDSIFSRVISNKGYISTKSLSFEDLANLSFMGFREQTRHSYE